MRKVTLVRGARQLLTLHGPTGPRRGADLSNLGLIQDGAVLIVDGLIHEVGPARRLESLALARQADEIDASGCVVMPGFVDSHTQLVGGPARMLDYELRLAGASTEQIAEAGGGTVSQARAIQDLSPRTLETLALKALGDAVRHGTTTVETKSGLGLTESGEIKILRTHCALQKQPVLIVSTFLSAQVSPEFEEKPDDYLKWICGHMLPLVARRKLAEFADIRCGAGAFSLEHACRYLTAARELGFGLKVHSGSRPNPGVIRMAVELGATSVNEVLHASAEDADVLSQSQTVATLLPGAAFFRGGERHASARMLIDSGAVVALATNYNPDTVPSQNMQMIVALACRSMKMTPAEAIVAATLNAAYAVRRQSSVGSLEIGKSADLLILAVSDFREISYHFGLNLMDRVIKRGEVLVERSEVKWPVH